VTNSNGAAPEIEITPIANRPRTRVVATGWALLAAVAALGACSAAAAPTPTTAAARPTGTPLVAATLSPTPSPTPSPTVAVVKISPIPGAPDSGTVVQLVAFKVRWIPTTLTAPAGKIWHVKIENRDGPPEHHNFAVRSGKSFAEQIYQSPNFVMGTFTYDIPALPAGSYLFICTVHTEVMTGALTIR
jgi:plastocyanin